MFNRIISSSNCFIRLFFVVFVILLSFNTNGSRINKLKIELQKTANSEEYIQKMVELAKIYKYVDIDSSKYFCDKIYPLALTSKNPTYEIEALILKSDINRRKGDYESAMDFATMAREKAIKVDNKSLYANIMLSFGGVYLDLGAFDLAYENYMSALGIFNNITDKDGLYWCYNNLGILMSLQGQAKESLEYLKMAEDGAISIQDNVLIAAVFNNIGLYYFNHKDLEQAEGYIRKSLSICKSENLTMLIIYNYANLAILHANNKNYDESMKAWFEAESIADYSGIKYELLRAKNGIGWLYYEMGDATKALEYFNKSYNLSLGIGSVEMAKINLSFLSKIYYELGDMSQAYIYSVNYSKFTDSLNKLNNTHNMMKLKYEYDYQREKESLIWQNRVRNIIIVVLFIILSLIVFSVIIMMKRHKLKISNIELSKTQLQSELEHKSREMTTKLIYLQKKNDMIAVIADQLSRLKPQMKLQNQNVIDEVINTLKNNVEGDNWKEFELRFEEVHGGFMKKLNEKFHDLTQNEKRLCAYLRLNMTTKEIASLLYLSVHSVDSARYRLRKKLNLTNSDTDISTFLEQF